MDFGRLNTAQRISAISILVVAVAAFLPWASLFGISKSEIEGDGVITLILALAGGVVLVLSSGLVGAPRATGRGWQIGLIVLAALVAIIGLVDMNSVAAMGLYLTLFGGLAWLVGAVWQVSLSRSSEASSTDSTTPDE
jgi:hypothetical protein